MTGTLDLHESVARAIRHGERGVELPPGSTLCTGELLPERFCHVFNNDHGLKRVLFDIDQADDFTLDGRGANLMIVGEVVPVRIGRSRNITVKNLTIDWRRPFFSQAVVIDSGSGWLEFEADHYPLRVDRGRLIAHDGMNWQTDCLWNLLPFDPVRREVSCRKENWQISRWHRASTLGEARFRLEADFAETYPPGTPVVLMHGNRAASGVFIEESENVRLENVTIHHAPGMGVIAQLSRNVALDRVRVIPSGDRLFSTWVDAIHLVDCAGDTRITRCEVRGMFDDAVNIHGCFSRVLSVPEPHAVRLQIVHPQRFGKNAARPGAGIALHLQQTLERVLVTRVLECRVLNQEVCDVTLEDPVPRISSPLVACEHTTGSSVEIRDCSFGPNRGRGCLLNVDHRVLVENCHFHVSGHAIESVPDANYWWEGPPCQDVSIRNNHFEDCGFGPCGGDLIRVGPEFPDGSDPRLGPLRDTGAATGISHARPVLRNFSITGNTIDRHCGAILRAHNLDGLTFSGNCIRSSSRYHIEEPSPVMELGPGVTNASIIDPVVVVREKVFDAEGPPCMAEAGSRGKFLPEG